MKSVFRHWVMQSWDPWGKENKQGESYNFPGFSQDSASRIQYFGGEEGTSKESSRNLHLGPLASLLSAKVMYAWDEILQGWAKSTKGILNVCHKLHTVRMHSNYKSAQNVLDDHSENSVETQRAFWSLLVSFIRVGLEYSIIWGYSRPAVIRLKNKSPENQAELQEPPSRTKFNSLWVK